MRELVTLSNVFKPLIIFLSKKINISDSTPYDFSSSEFKNPKVRNSKNTCVEH
jgi:hypothetical protein